MSPRPISTYSDVAPIWDTAARLNYLELNYSDEKTAIYVNQRLNALRKKLRDLNAELRIPGIQPSSPYDHLVIRRIGTKLIIEPRPITAVVARDAEGNIIKIEETKPSIPAELINLRNELGLDT